MPKLVLSSLICTAIATALLLDERATTFSRVLFSTGAGILIANVILLIVESTATRRFATWLTAHGDEIERSGSSWKGVRITPDTELVQFMFIVSFVFLTAELRTRYYVATPHRPVIPALLYSLITLISGWWSILGLVSTPLATYKNLTFASRLKVRQVMGLIKTDEKYKKAI